MNKKIIIPIICLGLGLTSHSFAVVDSYLISDGSNIIKHDVKKTNRFRIKIVFDDDDKGDIIPSINEVSDNMYGEYKVFKKDDFSYRFNIQLIINQSKVYVLSNVWKIPISNDNQNIKIKNIFNVTELKTTDKTIIKLEETPIKLIVKDDTEIDNEK